MLSNIGRGLPGLYFAFAIHGGRSVQIFLIPNQLPRAIFAGVFTEDFVSAIMISQTGFKIIRMANIKLSGRILKNVTPEHALFPSCPDFQKLAPVVGFEPTTK